MGLYKTVPGIMLIAATFGFLGLIFLPVSRALPFVLGIGVFTVSIYTVGTAWKIYVARQILNDMVVLLNKCGLLLNVAQHLTAVKKVWLPDEFEKLYGQYNKLFDKALVQLQVAQKQTKGLVERDPSSDLIKQILLIRERYDQF